MRRETGEVIQGVALVAAFTAWCALVDVLHARLQLGSLPALSPWRLSLIVLDMAVTCGGIVWLGCVRHGRGSFRALSWAIHGRPGWMLLLSLLHTACFSLLAYGTAVWLFGSAGIAWLTSAAASMPASERLFFLVLGSKVAFVEESLFRGFVLPAFSAKWGVLAAVLGSSLLFAVSHRTLAPTFLLVKLIFGVVSAAFVLRCRSLVPTAIAHAALWTIFGDN